MEFTKEQLIKHAQRHIEHSSWLASKFGLDYKKPATVVLAEIALAALTAEPVASGYQPAIDILRDRAARELDGGFRAHHNALIYAANELENAQAFGQEVSHES